MICVAQLLVAKNLYTLFLHIENTILCVYRAYIGGINQAINRGSHRLGQKELDMTDHSNRDTGGQRLSINLSKEIAAALDEIAAETDSTKTAVIRNAIALLKLAHDEKQKGRHLGFASSSEKLDTEIVGNF